MLNQHLERWEAIYGDEKKDRSPEERFSYIISCASEQSGIGVFNPFSVLNSFDKREFGDYWFQTGTPTFLVELLKKSEYDLRILIDGIEANASSFMEYRVEANNPIPLIYQSGYLTIKGYDERFKTYLLQFPNDEVRYGFMDFLVPYYTSVVEDERGYSN